MDGSMPDVSSPSGPEGSGDGNHVICASLESLSVNGTPPAEGDTVSAKVDGTVQKIEGDRAYIEVSKVNDQDVPADSGDKSEPSGDETGLMKMAQAADNSY